MREVTGKRLGSGVSSALCRDGGQGSPGPGDPPCGGELVCCGARGDGTQGSSSLSGTARDLRASEGQAGGRDGAQAPKGPPLLLFPWPLSAPPCRGETEPREASHTYTAGPEKVVCLKKA